MGYFKMKFSRSNAQMDTLSVLAVISPIRRLLRGLKRYLALNR